MKNFNKIKSVGLVTFAFIANVAFAQNLKVTSHGNPVANNDVIDLPYEVEDLSIPGTIDWFRYLWDPHIEASISEGIEEMTVTVTSLENAEGFQLCWPSGCQMVKPGESTSAEGVVNDEPVDLQIHKEVSFTDADSRPSEGGKIKVTIKTEEETFELTVNCLLTEENAVGENIADVYVTPEYFNLQGVHVAEPQKGQLVIERKGGKTAKRIF